MNENVYIIIIVIYRKFVSYAAISAACSVDATKITNVYPKKNVFTDSWYLI